MQLEGLRVHIAGSADLDCDPRLIIYAHELVAALVAVLHNAGCSFIVGVGKEPKLNSSSQALSIIFDWAVLERIVNEHQKRDYERKHSTCVVYSVGTQKTASQIPDDRRVLWETLHNDGLIHIEYVEPGWVSGAVRRHRMSQLGDILIAIGGGEGVEHLAQQYVIQGKPVIPLDLELGASCRDGNGGAPLLAKRLFSYPEDFLRVQNKSRLGSFLTQTLTEQGRTPVMDVINAIMQTIDILSPPTAFYVRLLDPEADDYEVVETFFQEIVTPVVREAGYTPYQMGVVDTDAAWMNDQIFSALQYSGVVIADITGHRPNCFLELGFALGVSKRVLVVANNGTKVPFDISPIEIHFWTSKFDNRQIDEFRDYWRRNIDRPFLVKPKRLV